MQRSGQFVLYRYGYDADTQPVREFFKFVYLRHNTEDDATQSLDETPKLDKPTAFREAVANPGNWCVGELVSDKTGVHVEE